MDQPIEKQTPLGAIAEHAQPLEEFLDALKNGAHPTDPRWLAMARTHFQEGFMALRRAVHPRDALKL